VIRSILQKIFVFRTFQDILCIVFFIIPFASGYGQPARNNNYFSPDKRLQFGTYLYKDKDYLRAANEFKEYLKINSSDTIQFRLSNSFFKVGRFTEASDNFKGLFFSSTISEEARLMFFESSFFENDFNKFRSIADQDIYNSSKYRKEIERLKFISYFFDNTAFPAENIFLEPFPDSVQSQIAKFYIQRKIPSYKSPATAAILSTLLPGAGKIYTGEIGDGITALATTALSAYLAYTNFKADHQFRGWLFTGLTAFFYSGNIYGSAASAQIYNARIRFDFDKEVKFYFEQRNYFLPKIDL
jgi:TM2 domain-containing membrane protein YozV